MVKCDNCGKDYHDNDFLKANGPVYYRKKGTGPMNYMRVERVEDANYFCGAKCSLVWFTKNIRGA